MSRAHVLLLLFPLIYVPSAYAALPPFALSIEDRIALADCAFIGHVIRVEKTPPPSTAIIDPWWKVTAHVDQGLVGASNNADVVFWYPADWVTFTVDPLSVRKLFILQKESCCTRDPRYLNIPLTLSQPGTISPMPCVLTRGGLSDIPNMNLRPFESEDELLNAISPYRIRPCPIARDEAISIYRHSAWCSVLLVPVDSRSEKLAQDWIQTNDTDLRWDGVRLLRWFKSTKNANLLRRVAELPPTSEANEVTREMAMRALESWGVPVKLRARVEAAPGMRWDLIRLALMILIPPIMFFVILRRLRRASMNRLHFLVTAWFAIFSTITVLWLRSFWSLDGLSFGSWEIGVVQGDIWAVSGERGEGNVDWPLAYRAPYQLRLVPPEASRWGLFDSSDLIYYFIRNDGVDSWLEDTGCYWAFTRRYLMPCWLIDAVLIIPWLLWFLSHWIDRQIERRRRGFPVVLRGLPN
jgi:hypothetical protein